MKRLIKVLCTAVCALGISDAHASLVSQWNFNTGTVLPSNASSQDAHVTGTPTLAATIPANANNTAAAIASQALAITYGGNHVTDINGTVLTLTINTSGAAFSGFTATYDSTFTSVTALSGTWSYSVNGGSFVNIGTSEPISASGANTDTLTGLALSQNDSLVLHFTLSGAAGGNSGTVSFDNFTIDAGAITPVPEPVTSSLAVFGLIFVGGGVGRFYFRKLRCA